MKHVRRLSVVLVVVSLVLIGCVPKSQLDQANSDLQTALAQQQELSTQLEETRSQLKTSQDELEQTKNDLQDAQDQVDQLQAELKDSQSEADKLRRSKMEALARAQVIEAIFVPTLSGQIDPQDQAAAAQLFLDWSRKIDATGDQQLKNKFANLITSAFSLDATVDFMTYAIQSLVDSLE
jgi:outer membrane murein-binding lipoprotein Lpp